MTRIVDRLNNEWSTLATSREARCALARWRNDFPVFMDARDLNDVIVLGYEPDMGSKIRRALAGFATNDDLAARTLLQALLGGLVELTRSIGRDDEALGDIVGLAWERIRTYPIHRPGSVSGNVLLDVRKRYRSEHDNRSEVRAVAPRPAAEPSAEEAVITKVFLESVVETGRRNGLTDEVIATILRSRVDGESMAALAAEQNVSRKVLWHRRWRGEAQLRTLPLAG